MLCYIKPITRINIDTDCKQQVCWHFFFFLHCNILFQFSFLCILFWQYYILAVFLLSGASSLILYKVATSKFLFLYCNKMNVVCSRLTVEIHIFCLSCLFANVYCSIIIMLDWEEHDEKRRVLMFNLLTWFSLYTRGPFQTFVTFVTYRETDITRQPNLKIMLSVISGNSLFLPFSAWKW